MQKIRWFFLILVVVAGVTLVLLNNQLTPIHLFGLKTVEMPFSILLLSTTGIGFVLGAIMTATMLRSRRKKEKEKERQIEAATSDSDEPLGA
jgi:uncharacterized membrane protein YciS (DUF1049 family)